VVGSPTVAGYEILSVLGQGGMGVVYKALQVSLNRPVALKKIRDEAFAGPQALARFQVEAEAVARLNHPHIVQVHDCGAHQGLPYFSMEFMEGGCLSQRLAAGPLPVLQAAQLMETLARAIHYAHGQSILHRDLKPANVLLTAAGIPKIADFGLAKRLDQPGGLTVTNLVMGTASYMAPEQAEARTQDIGPATDVYALGAILYEALTGRPPFRGETRELTIYQVVADEPVPPSRLRPDVPSDLEAICLTCLEKEPGQRYASALALAEDLHRFREGEPISARPVGEGDWYRRWAQRAGYEILDIAGCSVLGMVYKARHLRLNRIVLLKTISARAQNEPAKMARFRAEAEAAARLQHPNIVQIYDYGEQSGQPYFSVEFVDGGTLAEKCLGTALPARQTADLIATLARAAHYAHEQGIVHSELRPFNVLLSNDGIPKITGFGLARLLEKNRPELETTGAPLGLSNYMAPEQAEGRIRDVGPATDVHALGAMLYELLTGQPPFLADTVLETLEQVRTMIPLAPCRLQPDISPDLEAICLKCLQKDPSQRHPSAAALAEALQRFLQTKLKSTEEFELFPGYEILEELGRGGIGIVHKARQVSLDRLVALKIFHDWLTPKTLTRIKATYRAIARLQHPNIVQVYDCGERDGWLYVAEELVDGVSLDQKSAGAPQPPREAAHLIATLAEAIHHAHQHGVIHRNLKPRVVLLTRLNNPKISSFELAKLVGEPAQEPEAEESYSGTPLYMAPEQAAGSFDEISSATDVYTLGNLLYQLLTGKPPFASENALNLLEEVRSQPPVPPRRLNPHVPLCLELICLKCLQKEPGKRYGSAGELARELRHFLEGKPFFDLPRRLWQQIRHKLRALKKGG
jgi:serine/threonine protein kinase